MTEPPASQPGEHELVTARIGAAAVLTMHGERKRMRDFWVEEPCVNAFVRHFGCLFCHQMVDEVVQAVPELAARGARIVIVGNGTPEQARHFFESKGLPRSGVEVATDPARDTFRAAGFERGVAKTFLNAGSRRAYARARSGGHRITGLFGDLTQLGGVLVVRPPAMPMYLHRSRFAGDHPDMREVMAALDRRSSIPAAVG